MNKEQILIKGARIIDPFNINEKKDIIIKGGLIHDIVEPGRLDNKTDLDIDFTVIDASRKILVPGLIDVHVHLREPGQEHKETIETGLMAAAKGGFTTVCCMPNTLPVNDNPQISKLIIQRGKQAGFSRVYPVGAISCGSDGKILAEIHEMKQAGIVAVSDDGRPVSDPDLMRQALEYCKELNIPVLVHAEDLDLAAGGSMNEGSFSTLLGIRGIPNASESVMVLRDIALAELTGSSVHFCHVSTKESVEAIRQAKNKGIAVSCETAPHYFTLTDADIKDYNTNFKMNPPLRSEEDRQAIIEGLRDDTIDMIASDHAPHSITEKDVEFEQAPFGIIGLETSLSLSLKLVHKGILSLEKLIDKMAKQPAKLLGLNNDIKKGNIADLTLIDPDDEYIIDPDSFSSKSRNTPFAGMAVKGRAYMTFVNGRKL